MFEVCFKVKKFKEVFLIFVKLFLKDMFRIVNNNLELFYWIIVYNYYVIRVL